MEKQLYQLKKEGARQEQGRKQLMRSLQKYTIIIVIIIGVGFGGYLIISNAGPKGEDFSRAIPIMENITHIPVGSPLPQYTSDPPTSGPHYGQTARSGFREDIIPDQNIIHNLEHGDVWIAYHPRISDEVKDQLRQFGAVKVIVAPREANDTDIALIAWGRLDTFNIVDNALPVVRIKDFIKRYINKGPERIPGASGGI